MISVDEYSRSANYPCGYTPIEPYLNQNMGEVKDARAHSWPWMADICKKHQDMDHCAGSYGAVIGNRWILTLSESLCPSKKNGKVPHMEYKMTKVFVGMNNRSEIYNSGVQSFEIKNTFCSDYDGTPTLTLIQLNSSIEYSQFVQPICLAATMKGIQVRESALWSTGWNIERTSDGLQQSKNAVDVDRDFPNLALYINGTDVYQRWILGSPLMFQGLDRRWYLHGVLNPYFEMPKGCKFHLIKHKSELYSYFSTLTYLIGSRGLAIIVNGSPKLPLAK
ncbi:trypsin domain-containing protein [Ditylenchus destructor]|uniref:Trypsin domain-containing protein n=1 Tax=Ditylenchus destructor TaxID=166010 RepID=A0AAD4MF30_9BILA|nr:trypsin domain-containing protein [Ditylenchus destructor]